MVTAILMALVLFAWFLVSRLQNLKMVKQLAQEARPGSMPHASQQQPYHAGPYTITGFWTTRGASGVWGDGAIRGRNGNTWNGNGDCGASIVSGADGGCGGGCGAVSRVQPLAKEPEQRLTRDSVAVAAGEAAFHGPTKSLPFTTQSFGFHEARSCVPHTHFILRL